MASCIERATEIPLGQRVSSSVPGFDTLFDRSFPARAINQVNVSNYSPEKPETIASE